MRRTRRRHAAVARFEILEGRTLLSVIPNDSDFPQQWGLSNSNNVDINAPQAWDITTGSSSVVVADIALEPSGVDITHPDLVNRIWTNPNGGNDPGYPGDLHGWNFYTNSPDVTDSTGHDTNVAGIVSAQTNNSQGIAGVTWNGELMPLVIGPSLNEMADAVDFAVSHGAKVLNFSFAYTESGLAVSQDPLYQAIQQAASSGVVAVAAAGNNSQDLATNPVYPAAFDLPNEITVAGIDSDGSLDSTSNYGASTVDLAAPGSNIYTTQINNTYISFAGGTSFAAPFVDGVVALVQSEFPSLSAQQDVQLVVNNTKPESSLSGKTISGGMVDAFNALLAGFPNPTASASVTGRDTQASLSVGDNYGNADPDLTYTWSVTSMPSGVTPPAFSANGTSSAKTTTATFYAAGNYTFQATVANGDGFSRTVSVSVTVNQTANSITVSPSSATVPDGQTQGFSASVTDQFGAAISSPSLTWSVRAGGVGGTISQSGIYTTPASGAGTDTVQVASGSASATATVTVTSASQNAIAIDCGSSSSVGSFAPDADFSGGSVYSYPSNTIDTSGVGNPPPQQVFQTGRFGNFSYTIPNLTAKTAYTIRLDFAEVYWTGPNQRVFDVAINGVSVLTNFDVYAAANGMNKAIAESFVAAASSQGQISIQFTSVKDNAFVAGIEISQASDLALNQPAQSSTNESSSYTPNYAVDGNSSTRWSSGQWMQSNSIGWISVDLGADYEVNVVRLNWEAAYAVNFQIQISQDANTWTDLEDVQGNASSGVQVYSGLSGYGRYVRIFCTQLNSTNNYSLYDLNVYGVAASDLSLNKPAQSSSNESSSYTPNYAVDGNSSTRWSSGQWLQNGATEGWIYVDLGAFYDINEVKLDWQAAYAVNYTIQVSLDASASSWETIQTVVNNGSSGWLDYHNLSGTGRYLRIDCTQLNGTNNYSLWDLNVFGTPATDLALNRPAQSSTNESSSYTPNYAVDGNSSTRWSSGQWQVTPYTQVGYIYVDLGAPYEIQEVRLNWETAYAVNYAIQASNDPTQGWTVLENITGNSHSGVFDFTQLEPAEPSNSNQAPVAYRYVEIYCTQVSSGSNNYSLYDFNVFGVPSNTSNPAFMMVAGGTSASAPMAANQGPLSVKWTAPTPGLPRAAGRTGGGSSPAAPGSSLVDPLAQVPQDRTLNPSVSFVTDLGATAFEPSAASGPILTASDLEWVLDDLLQRKAKTGLRSQRVVSIAD